MKGYVYFSAGDIVWPDQVSSASILGNLDSRLDLDKSIKADDDEKYKGSLSIMAAKLSYENKDFIQNVVQNHWKVYIIYTNSAL